MSLIVLLMNANLGIPDVSSKTTFPSFTSRSQSSPADDISDPFILTLHSTVIPPLQT